MANEVKKKMFDGVSIWGVDIMAVYPRFLTKEKAKIWGKSKRQYHDDNQTDFTFTFSLAGFIVISIYLWESKKNFFTSAF